LFQHSPEGIVSVEKQKQQQLQHRLEHAMQVTLNQKRTLLQNKSSRLNTVSPLATLARGYAIVKDKNGKITTDAANLQPGDKIAVRLDKGEFKAQVLGDEL
ncbi:MAG: exodeoxyribonuclease VII large subunit, partial [Marinobacter maritimus]